MLSVEGKKRLLFLLLIIFAVLVAIKLLGQGVQTFSFFNESAGEKLEKLPEHETVTLKDDKDYKVYYSEIVDIQDDTYFARSKDGFKFSFKEENLDEPLKDSLQIGDAVKAYFDITASVNGLSKVEKMK
ncbi:hypothetical protein [Bacillus sp. FJAT-47783]|uniref:hypothetical protein n=1 Tax=Bacillus sp. FJAT-47783 TaxID=2922712 RepID=UPI001FADAB17|nr:hypothetical protein [Bacillus sp. FJAT-47783]